MRCSQTELDVLLEINAALTLFQKYLQNSISSIFLTILQNLVKLIWRNSASYCNNILSFCKSNDCQISFSCQMIQYGNIIQWPPWAERLTRWNHVMLVTNSSVNIVIYVFQVVFIFSILYTVWIAISFRYRVLFWNDITPTLNILKDIVRTSRLEW